MEPLHVRFNKRRDAWTDEQFQKRVFPIYWSCPYHHEHRWRMLAWPCYLLYWLRCILWRYWS